MIRHQATTCVSLPLALDIRRQSPRPKDKPQVVQNGSRPGQSAGRSVCQRIVLVWTTLRERLRRLEYVLSYGFY